MVHFLSSIYYVKEATMYNFKYFPSRIVFFLLVIFLSSCIPVKIAPNNASSPFSINDFSSYTKEIREKQEQVNTVSTRHYRLKKKRPPARFIYTTHYIKELQFQFISHPKKMWRGPFYARVLFNDGTHSFLSFSPPANPFYNDEPFYYHITVDKGAQFIEFGYFDEEDRFQLVQTFGV